MCVCSLLLGELKNTLIIKAEVCVVLYLQVINVMTSHQVAGTGSQTDLCMGNIGNGNNL